MEKVTQLKDEELVSQYLLEDNELAFIEIVNRYLKPLYNFTYRLCGNTSEAEEITQESFLKIWKKLHTFKQGEKFKTWIYTIARNTTIDHLRKKKSLVFSDFDREDGDNFLEDTLVDTEILPDELFEKSEKKKDMEELLSTLSVHYREVLILHYHESLSFEEISGVLEKPLNTVKSHHRRAIIALRKKLENAPK